MRRTIFLATLLIAGASLARSQTSTQSGDYSSNNNVAAARCYGSQLMVDDGSEDAGAGQRFVTFAFTNTSSRPCTLRGFPKFVLLKSNGLQLPGITVTHNDDPPQEVTLAPGGKAFFIVRYSSCLVGGPRPCRISSKARITAPGTTRAFIRRARFDPSQGIIDVSPVQSTAP